MPFQRHSEQFTCHYARLSFPNVWVPKPIMMNGRQIGDPRYSALVLVDPRQVPVLQQLIQRLVTQSWPEWAQGQPPAGIALKGGLRQGEIVRPGDEHLAGQWVLSANASADKPPRVVTQDPGTGEFHPVTDQSLVYSGCEAHVFIGVFTTQMSVSEPQVNFGLNKICLTGRQLPGFGGYTTDEQAFGNGPSIDAPPVPEGVVPVAPPPVAQPSPQANGVPVQPYGGAQLPRHPSQGGPAVGQRPYDPNDPTTW